MAMQTSRERLEEARKLQEISRVHLYEFLAYILKGREELVHVAGKEATISQHGSLLQKARYDVLRLEIKNDLVRIFRETGAASLPAGDSHDAMAARLLHERPTMMHQLAVREVGQFLYDRRELK